MLPTHVFADVVACLHFYELDALSLTDAQCSNLAHSSSSRIRTFDSSDYEFLFYNPEVHIYWPGAAYKVSKMVLRFRDARDVFDFISAALRNCTLRHLTLSYRSSIDATKDVAHTVVVKGTLYLQANAFVTMHALVEFATSFRSVQVHC